MTLPIGIEEAFRCTEVNKDPEEEADRAQSCQHGDVRVVGLPHHATGQFVLKVNQGLTEAFAEPWVPADSREDLVVPYKASFHGAARGVFRSRNTAQVLQEEIGIHWTDATGNFNSHSCDQYNRSNG